MCYTKVSSQWVLDICGNPTGKWTYVGILHFGFARVRRLKGSTFYLANQSSSLDKITEIILRNDQTRKMKDERVLGRLSKG